MMETGHDDRRVRKTKRALREGLAALLREKDLRSITVKELTDKADVHRSTFYAHYEDIYHLYQTLEDTVIEELSGLISSNFSLCFQDYYAVLFEYMAENEQLCKMLFQSKDSLSFFHRLTELFQSACLRSWRNALGLTEVSEELSYYAQYHLQGCFAMIGKWAGSDFEYPREKMIRLLADIDANMELHLKKARHTV